MTLVKENALKHEENVIWLEDRDNYTWVRESSTDFPTKQGISKNRRSEIERGGKKLIGYGELEEDAPSSKHYYRRIFMIYEGDYENYKNNYPTEAVDPLTVEPKTLGLSPKKKSQIAVRIPQSLHRKLNSYIRKTGMSQTDVVVSALASYFDSTEEVPLIQRIVAIEKRLALLEAKN